MKMKDDPIVAEVRKIRLNILESYGLNFEKMSRDVMKRQWESGHKVVTLAGKTPIVSTKPKVAEAGAKYGMKEQLT